MDCKQPAGRLALFVGLSIAVFTALPLSSSADPVAFATASAQCSGSYPGQIQFPVVSSAFPDTVVSFASPSGAGDVDTDTGDGDESFSPGDIIWGGVGEVDAGTAPTLTFDCQGTGTVTASLYNVPATPAAYSGTLTDSAGTDTSNLLFDAPGNGQYVANVQLNGGAFDLDGLSDNFSSPSDGPATEVASSGQYPLGAVTAGINDLGLSGLTGPAANYTVTISEVPVAISNLALNKSKLVASGTNVKASFSVSGDTEITATVLNGEHQEISSLGSYNVKEGNSSLVWNTLGAGGETLSDGTYYLKLTSTDPSGNTTTAEVAAQISNPITPTSRNLSAAFRSAFPAEAIIPKAEGPECATATHQNSPSAQCFFEYRLDGIWHLVMGTVKVHDGALHPEATARGSWRRRWVSCNTAEVFNAFHITPIGKLLSNNGCGKVAGTDAYFVASGFEFGDHIVFKPNGWIVGWMFTGSGFWPSLGEYKCDRHNQTEQCTNAVGDSFKYTP